jgi:hypothetical protein
MKDAKAMLHKIAEKVSYLCEIRTKEGHKKTKFWSIMKPVQRF